ncbi:pilus assembly protein N-terminal domain-containing protein [Xanthobacter sediminis]|uniref:pilus assembly protein N-terminal domain-containing protein n=1 Tax=Xanthobacter sediminis TaxID=3119926 RepID=UPI00372B0F56
MTYSHRWLSSPSTEALHPPPASKTCHLCMTAVGAIAFVATWASVIGRRPKGVKAASACMPTTRQLLIAGLADGATTIIATNANRRQVAVIEVRVSRDGASFIFRAELRLAAACGRAPVDGAHPMSDGLSLTPLQAARPCLGSKPDHGLERDRLS